MNSLTPLLALFRGMTLIVVCLLCQLARLTLLEHERFSTIAQQLQEPFQRLPACRGSIFDCQGQLLAGNRLNYIAGVCYGDLMQIPPVKAVWSSKGREKIYPRKSKVKELAATLSSLLGSPAYEIEDFIYSQAALNPSQKAVFRSHLSEETFHKLKALEGSTVGLRAWSELERYYPNGALAGQVLGYLGPIDLEEKHKQQHRLESLRAQLAFEEDGVAQQILEEEISRTESLISSLGQLVGKSGVERWGQSLLQGIDGYRLAGGHTRECEHGQHLTLCLDSRLQALAEEVLAEYEITRKELLDSEGHPLPSPWIKGGSIVVLEPMTGHVLACASYPRLDVERFTEPSTSYDPWTQGDQPPLSTRSFWLEEESWLEGLWQGRWDLWKEGYQPYEEHWSWRSQVPTWWALVHIATYGSSGVEEQLKRLSTLDRLGGVLYHLDQLEYHRQLSGLTDKMARLKQLLQLTGDESIDQACQEHRAYLLAALHPLNDLKEQALLIDLIQLLVEPKSWQEVDLELWKELTPDGYQAHCRALAAWRIHAKRQLRQWFKATLFQQWRAECERPYLKAMRAIEKEGKLAPKPYLYYLNQEEERAFERFWQEWAEELLLVQLLDLPMPDLLKGGPPFIPPLPIHLKTTWQELKISAQRWGVERFKAYLKATHAPTSHALWGQYSHAGVHSFQDILKLIYPRYGAGYLNHRVVSYPTAPGSLYKLTVAYAALMQRYHGEDPWSLNPLIMIDTHAKEGGKKLVGYLEDGTGIAQLYRGGRLPRSQRKAIGKIDLLGAIEASSNPYFSLLASNHLADPAQDLLKASYAWGWGTLTAIDLPFERKGSLPFDLETYRTGLYTTAIGQHTLLATPIQVATMMAALANGGSLLRPKIIDDRLPACVRGEVYLPDPVRCYLLEGMRRVVGGRQGSARWQTIVPQLPHGSHREAVRRVAPYMVGKTSTSEFVQPMGLLQTPPFPKQTHAWFAGILFDKPLAASEGGVAFEGAKPQLVVVVCLHFARFGREAFAPAALLCQRWRELYLH